MGQITQFRALPSEWINRLFQRLGGMYGSKFLTMWEGADIESVKQIWGESLGDFDAEEIRAGLDGCNSKPFPPTLPEFLLLCRPPIDPDTAMREAVEQMHRRHTTRDDVWSKPEIFWAASSIGNHDLRNLSSNLLRQRMASALESVRGKHDPVPPAPLQVEHKPLSRDDAQKVLEHVTGKLGEILAEKTDYKAWAKRILANPENFPHISVQFAHEALKTESGEIVA